MIRSLGMKLATEPSLVVYKIFIFLYRSDSVLLFHASNTQPNVPYTCKHNPSLQFPHLGPLPHWDNHQIANKNHFRRWRDSLLAEHPEVPPQGTHTRKQCERTLCNTQDPPDHHSLYESTAGRGPQYGGPLNFRDVFPKWSLRSHFVALGGRARGTESRY